jgi:hypothetical protein
MLKAGVDVFYVLTGERGQPIDAKGAWLRLKAELRIDNDTKAARWLGMSTPEVNDYTERGLFPVQQFVAAHESRAVPLDKDYVLYGVSTAAREMIGVTSKGKRMSPVSRAESDMLDAWRRCSPADQSMLLVMMGRLGGPSQEAAQTTSSVSQTFNGPVSGHVAGRNLVINKPETKR